MDEGTVTITAKGKSVTMKQDDFLGGKVSKEAEALMGEVIEESLGLVHDPDPDDEVGDWRMGMLLKSVAVTKARDGKVLTLNFEGGPFHVDELAELGDGLEVVFDRVAVGTGATLGGLTVAKDADGDRMLRFRVTLPESEITRTRGRIFEMVDVYGLVVLTRMQQTLGLDDGTEVDLTKRAE